MLCCDAKATFSIECFIHAAMQLPLGNAVAKIIQQPKASSRKTNSQGVGIFVQNWALRAMPSSLSQLCSHCAYFSMYKLVQTLPLHTTYILLGYERISAWRGLPHYVLTPS